MGLIEKTLKGCRCQKHRFEEVHIDQWRLATKSKIVEYQMFEQDGSTDLNMYISKVATQSKITFNSIRETTTKPQTSKLSVSGVQGKRQFSGV